MRRILFFLFLSTLLSVSQAQRPIKSSSDILQEINKLNVVTNVLYVAAHPDDENTRLIAWLENEKLARTAYLSLTRGDGGQNLIGSEKGDAMGVLRTQELLEARRTDGGEQFFSRATDFGYSKTAEETFEKWDKEKVLGDVVWVIRKFKPDVIVTRFPPDGRGGHGHHTASSILAEEAFKLAADPKAYPEQLKLVDTWQAKRILWDVYWWNKQVREEAIASGGIIDVNIGDYNELIGESYSEIAAESRSQHKSQGFGSMKSRGNRLEYLKHTKGDQAEKDLFEGVNTSWTRVEGGEKIQKSIGGIIADYDVSQPAKSVEALVSLYSEMEKLKQQSFVEHKMKELQRIIKAASGIYVEVLANDYSYIKGDEIKGKFTVIKRSASPINLISVEPKIDTSFNSMELKDNELNEFSFSIKTELNNSNPYWLPASNYEKQITANSSLRASPENSILQKFNYVLDFNGTKITFEEDIDYKWSERVDGELHRNVIVSPKVTATPAEKVFIFSEDQTQSVDLLLESSLDDVSSSVQLIAPEGWKVEPGKIDFELKTKGEQKKVSFKLTPPKKSSTGEISFKIGNEPAKAVQRIDYPHIKPQIVFPDAKAKVVKMDLNKSVKSIGYLIGSGDEVAQNLGQVGFEVTSFNAEELPLLDLSKFETIIVGIRAYNTEESLKSGNNILNEYVKSGGNVIVQYNTNRGLKSENIGPYSFQISRNRVTKEEAKPTFLKPEHPLFNSPNKLTEVDFENWVQERGLYFADEWDEKYETVIAWNDPGEDSQEGSILVADYGEGHFIYTGISFFRQLPVGVPGAYRLLTNMISYGKD